VFARRAENAEERADLAAVWSAVSAACADAGVAEDVTAGALVRARLGRRRGAPLSRRRLLADAVRQAVELAPCAPLSELSAAEREAIALARYARLDINEIAATVGVETSVINGRLRAGLRAVASRGAPLTEAPGRRSQIDVAGRDHASVGTAAPLAI
jgi:predicted DNA-binding protein (UPF0251 family)